MPDYISKFQSGQEVDALLDKADKALPKEDFDSFKNGLGNTYYSKTEVDKIKTNIEGAVDTKISEGLNAKLNINTYNNNNTMINMWADTVETKLKTLEELEKQVTGLEESKVSVETYNENNEKLGEWATTIGGNVSTLLRLVKKKTIASVTTGTWGGISLGLSALTSIFLMAKSDNTGNPSGLPLLFFPYIFSNGLYLVPSTYNNATINKLGSSKTITNLVVWYLDLTGLEVEEGASPASISDDDLFDTDMEFPV